MQMLAMNIRCQGHTRRAGFISRLVNRLKKQWMQNGPGNVLLVRPARREMLARNIRTFNSWMRMRPHKEDTATVTLYQQEVSNHRRSPPLSARADRAARRTILAFPLLPLPQPRSNG